ncbi:MAG TPA: hypothetical protein VEP49_22400 [Acidimicrobiia bacterium]|nr:hypothetical protein [Acidimicrobiia bacterium]
MSTTRRRAGGVLVTAVVAAVVGSGLPARAANAPNLGNGVGTQAALRNPDCDPATGQVRILLIARPPCVRHVAAAQNGGATAPGVTRNTVKVVIVTAADPTTVPSDIAGAVLGGTNQATGKTGTLADAERDENEMLSHFYETYGRKLDVEFYVRTGIDEAAQRADALAIAEKKPFAVLAALPITGQILAQKKIISFDTPTDPKVVQAQSPYRYSWSTDYVSTSLQAAEVLGKELWGGKAKWAGDDSMHAETRKFGIVYPSSPDASAYPDLGLFEKTVKKYGGGTIATKIGYTEATGSDTSAINSQNQQNAVPIVAKLKDAGVTTVVAIASSSMLQGLTKAATQQEYNPEWFCAEWFNCSFDYFARQLDQQQWAHAFGVGSLYPALEGDAVDGQTQLFQWYWGKDRGTVSSYMFSILDNTYLGIHMAGPKLTAATFQAGLWSKPMQGGAASGSVTGLMNGYGPQVGLPYPAFAASGEDGGLWWYNADIEGVSNVFKVDGKGKAMWMFGGKRYRPGQYPKGEQPLFDPTKAIAFLPGDADAALVPKYECTGCPSQKNP